MIENYDPRTRNSQVSKGEGQFRQLYLRSSMYLVSAEFRCRTRFPSEIRTMAIASSSCILAKEKFHVQFVGDSARAQRQFLTHPVHPEPTSRIGRRGTAAWRISRRGRERVDLHPRRGGRIPHPRARACTWGCAPNRSVLVLASPTPTFEDGR